eukprot:gene17739-24099_t
MPPRSSAPYNMRLRGRNPMIETDASNLSVVMDISGGGDDCVFSVYRGSNAALVVESYGNGVSMSASDKKLVPFTEPFMSFQTARGSERLRLDSNGVSCGVLTAGMFTNLIDEWTSHDVYIPPTANALTNAFATLSNMVVIASVSGGGGGGGTYYPTLVDSYRSTSVLEAPTANALRGAYYNLSNLLALRLHDLSSALPGTSIVPSEDGTPAYSVEQFNLSNDVWLQSLDGQPRFMFNNDGATIFAASSDDTEGAQSFRWINNDMQMDIASVSVGGDMQLRGGIMASNVSRFGSNVSVQGDVLLGKTISASDVTVRSNLAVAGAAAVQGNGAFSANVTVGGDLTLGEARLSHVGNFVGFNLAPGEEPVCAFHVNGAVYSTEQMYALSDRSVKSDVRPILDALDKLSHITGCTYTRIDEATGVRHVGVIAQDVHSVVPEAVQVGSDGRMSVAYGSLVAVAIEGIKELQRQRANDVALIRRLVRWRKPRIRMMLQQQQ